MHEQSLTRVGLDATIASGDQNGSPMTDDLSLAMRTELDQGGIEVGHSFPRSTPETDLAVSMGNSHTAVCLATAPPHRGFAAHRLLRFGSNPVQLVAIEFDSPTSEAPRGGPPCRSY